jgi:hypothetical protein
VRARIATHLSMYLRGAIDFRQTPRYGCFPAGLAPRVLLSADAGPVATPATLTTAALFSRDLPASQSDLHVRFYADGVEDVAQYARLFARSV